MSTAAVGSQAAGRADRADLGRRFEEVRAASEALCAPLAPDDFVVQTMPDVSPTKWHLAHTTWFFETLALLPHASGYRPAHEQYQYLFNSYYNTLGKQYCRPDRGFLVRPTTEEVFQYRHAVDEAMVALLENTDDATLRTVAPIVEVGIHHEQQHQELMITDIKHVFASNPIVPVYRPAPEADAGRSPGPLAWRSFPEAVREIGHGRAGFRYDNETPRHRVLAPAFEISNRLVTAGEYLEFLADGGYERPELWLSDGWSEVQARGWKAPLYWGRKDGEWWMATLSGERPVGPAEPVCHVSFYEADAYARWKGARLATEVEWETVAAEAVAAGAVERGNFVEAGRMHTAPVAAAGGEPAQLFGDVWEWTASPYIAYPGFRPPEGALGEYNAKFMCNQMVLRGGSCATPRSHIRETYRNFFPPSARWQFSGIRLARDVETAR